MCAHQNIILIGMPGAGKSTIGIVLAKILGYEFLDTDLLIQKEEGKRLWEIIEEKGSEGFLKIEERVNSSICPCHSVVAPGGSVIYGEKAMKHLKGLGTVVYLKVTLEQLERRLGNLHNRGVVTGPGVTLKDLYEERTPLYEKYADLTVDETDINFSETVSAILGALGIART